MLDQSLLRQAREKFNDNGIKNYQIRQDLMDNFILRMYINCNPASYGKKFVKKLLYDQEGLLHGVSDRKDRGDIKISYPSLSDEQRTIYDPINNRIKVLRDETDSSRKFFEVKISYLSKNGNYSVRNIRPHQEFDYFLLCFVDCEDDFKPQFMVVDKDSITCFPLIYKLTPMNGTKEANRDNSSIGYGLTVSKNGRNHNNLISSNLLNGTSYSNVIDFLNLTQKELKEEYIVKDRAA